MCLKDANGIWIHDSNSLKVTILQHFQDLYHTSLSHSFQDSFDSISRGPKINDSSWGDLVLPPTNAEIWFAIKSMKPWKAPGPDGLHAAFFQQYWDSINPKLCNEIRLVFSSGTMPESWNNSLICLIPKVQNPETISQFRPIGLCNVIYKIVTKIIVLRLRDLIGDLISPLQSSFIPGRRGTDNVFLLREFVYCFTKKKGRSGDMIIKIDLEKAYDRLE
ncbi:hypothetical protein SLA2020_046560 [Shorea laevis]